MGSFPSSAAAGEQTKENGAKVNPVDGTTKATWWPSSFSPSRNSRGKDGSTSAESAATAQALVQLFIQLSGKPHPTRITPKMWDKAKGRGIDLLGSQRPENKVNLQEWLVHCGVSFALAETLHMEHVKRRTQAQDEEASKVKEGAGPRKRLKEGKPDQHGGPQDDASAEAETLEGGGEAREKEDHGKTNGAPRPPAGNRGAKWEKEKGFILDQIHRNAIDRVNLSGFFIRAKGADMLARPMARNTSVTSLTLNTNELGDEGATYIARMLNRNSSLKSIILGNNGITDDGAKKLAHELQRNHTLLVLGLETNEISQVHLDRIRLLLQRNKDEAAEEQEEDPSKNAETALSAKVSSLNWKSQSTVILKSLDYVKSLDLSGQPLGPEGGKVIADRLKLNGTLAFLRLHTCKLTTTGASLLFKAMADNPSCALKMLDLNWNMIGDAAMEHALRTPGDLTSLNLAGNRITDEGIRLLLNRGTRLQLLDLGGNRIGNAGAWVVSDMLEFNHTVSKLMLNTNLISDAGAIGLAEAIESNESSALVRLDLHYNKVGDAGAEALGKVIGTRRLRHVDLRHNDMADSTLIGVWRHVRIATEMAGINSTDLV